MTIRIPLTQGYVAIVDDEDEHLAAFKWHVWRCPKKTGNVYAVRSAFTTDRKKVTLYLHREVLAPTAGRAPIDHKDGDGLNCRRDNLRVVNQTINNRNRAGAQKNSTTGFLGVYSTASSGKFVALIQYQGRLRNLGTYPTAEEANAARLAAERELWGIEPRRAQAHA